MERFAEYINESKESREAMKKLNLIHLSHNMYQNPKTREYYYFINNKMEKSSKEHNKLSDKIREKQIREKHKDIEKENSISRSDKSNIINDTINIINNNMKQKKSFTVSHNKIPGNFVNIIKKCGFIKDEKEGRYYNTIYINNISKYKVDLSYLSPKTFFEYIG